MAKAKKMVMKGKDMGLTVGGMTAPQKPKKHFATKAAKARMMKKSAPKY